MASDTFWGKIAPWYDKNMGEKGNYYHEHVVIPGTLKLLELKPGDRLLDLACGQGVLGRHIPKEVDYLGIDAAPQLIESAKGRDLNSKHIYKTGDVTADLKLGGEMFSHAAIILALQNIETPEGVIGNCARQLTTRGKLAIVLNHPAFRIPRQSSWEIDSNNKIEYRRINRYMSPLKIPVNAHPGERESAITWSFHYPLSTYSKMLYDAGLVIELMEEWTSDKESVGRAARMENRARSEFPLFLGILARRK